mmetsp:Transcript_21913/g.50031  ORF Transcript_21913/g.50031 Transcript_21913/m.50031 type:complete len:1835 (+) Transcript_21913:112-5616(+)
MSTPRPKSPGAALRSMASAASQAVRGNKTPKSQASADGDESHGMPTSTKSATSAWLAARFSLAASVKDSADGTPVTPAKSARSDSPHGEQSTATAKRLGELVSDSSFKARPRQRQRAPSDREDNEELSEAAAAVQRSRHEAQEFERACFIPYLTEEDFDTVFGFKWWRGRIKRVDLSAEKYRLETLVGPSGGLMHGRLNLSKCTFMDVSFNRLYDINVLQKDRGLDSLEVLLARSNHISSCSLRLPRLQELNLSFNEFRAPPLLDGLPHLQVLVLTHNQLNGEFPKCNSNLRLNRLDLGENLYDFPPSEFRRNLELLADLPDLRNLRLLHNPFIEHFQEYQVFVVKTLQRLAALDDVKIGKGMRRDIEELGLLALDNYDDVYKERADAHHKRHVDVNYADRGPAALPRLHHINQLLLGIIEDASMLVPNVDRLLQLVRVIPQPYYRGDITTDPEESFLLDTSDSKGGSTGLSSAFFELILGLIDKHEFTKDKLCEILGYLSCIAIRDFGYQCMDKLGKLMLSGQQLAKIVLNTLATVVVPNLLKLGTSDVKSAQTAALIKGLVHLLCIPEFMSRVAEAIGDSVEQAVIWFKAGSPQEGRSVAKLLAYLTESEKNTRAAVDQELIDLCVGSLNNQSMQEHQELLDVWLDIVRLLRNIIKYCSDELLDRLVRTRIHNMFIARARTVRRRPSSEAETKSLTWSEIVRTLTALMERRRDVLHDACRAFKYVMEIGENMQEFVVDPLVLASACEGLTVILRDAELFTDFGADVVRDLSGVTPLLLYLGGDKYAGLWDKAQRQIARRKGLPPPDTKLPPSLEHLRDPMCVDAFMAIIGLIEFFMEAEQGRDPNSEPDARSNLIESVNEMMNKQNRETILLGLLIVPLDSVKTAVMHAITKVPIKQLDREELGLIIKLLLETRNISAGNLEDMLCKAVTLLERVASSPEAQGAQFRQYQGEQAVLASHGVLMRNAQRSTYGSEEEEIEKSKLSLAIISFLRTCSRYTSLRKVMQTNQRIKESFPELLKLEEELVTPTMPNVAIEDTWIGRSVGSLMECLSPGPRALQNDKKQALRVLIRLADIFEGKTDVLAPAGSGPTLEELVNSEAKMWDVHHIMHMNVYLDNQEAEWRENQIKTFTLTRGVLQLLNFISRRSNSEQEHHLEQVLSACRKKVLEIRQGVERHEEEDEVKQDGEFETDMVIGKHIELEVGMKDTEEREGQEILLKSIQCHEIGDKRKAQLFHQRFDNMWREEVFVDEAKGTVTFVYMICAAMRIFHALLVASPEKLNSRVETIKELRQPHVIKQFLAEVRNHASTSCNVGPKFFRLISLLFRAVDVPGINGGGRLELFGMLSYHVAEMTDMIKKMVLAGGDKPQDIRRQNLCAEVAFFVETVVLLIPFQAPRAELYVTECLNWLVPWKVVDAIAHMILYDIHTDSGTAFGDVLSKALTIHLYTKADILEKATRCLSIYLSKHQDHKYDILYKFTRTAVFRNSSLNRAYLNELLSHIDLCRYTQHVEMYLQQTYADKDEFVFYLMPVWVVQHRRPAKWEHLLLAISNRRIYLITPDISKPPYSDTDSRKWEPSWEAVHPRDPASVQEFEYGRIQGMYRLFGNQLLAIQWKGENGADTDMCEVYIFERTADRDLFVDMVKNNYGSLDSDVSVTPYDPSIRDEVQKYTLKDPVLAVTVTPREAPTGTQLRLWAMTVKEVFEFHLNPTNLQCPAESELDVDERDFFNPATQHLNEAGEVVNEGKPGTDAMKPQASFSSRSTRAAGLLGRPLNRENLKDIQEIIFETDGNPDLLLKYKKGTQMLLKFFVASGRERWRRALVYHLSLKDRTWARHG